MSKKSSLQKSDRAQVNAFLTRLAQAPRPRSPVDGSRARLLFGLDATASRQPTWDQACRLQGDMFEQAATMGGLDVQLCFYRGYYEFHRTPWLNEARSLHNAMAKVRCVGGMTQIERMLKYALKEHRAKAINAMVLVGDVIEEDVDSLSYCAGQLGVLGVPVFVFQEGEHEPSRPGFEQIAKLSKGAHCAFDINSAGQLRDLLRAVAAFASGGMSALLDFERKHRGAAARLSHQINS